MVKVNALLSARFRKKEKESKKMASLAQSSTDGQLTSFSGIFGVGELEPDAKQELRDLLERFAPDEERNIEHDFQSLASITTEVRAISNQAAILHGERIKRAQQILIRYKEGAFSAWLVTTYGNRQTPYNFLQYYEFCQVMPGTLKSQIAAMPRQAVYSLASREGSEQKKIEIVQNYKGETKAELLELIREIFPLPQTDKRRSDVAEGVVTSLRKVCTLLEKKNRELSQPQKAKIHEWIDRLETLIT